MRVYLIVQQDTNDEIDEHLRETLAGNGTTTAYRHRLGKARGGCRKALPTNGTEAKKHVCNPEDNVISTVYDLGKTEVYAGDFDEVGDWVAVLEASTVEEARSALPVVG